MPISWEKFLKWKKQPTCPEYKLNLNIPRKNQVMFGTNRLKCYGPKIWNALSSNIKTAENLSAFKTN